MDEDILVAVLLDEPVPLRLVEPLHPADTLPRKTSINDVRMKYHKAQPIVIKPL